MSSRILDILVYSAATAVILAIISGATQAEREFKEETDSVDIIEMKEPLIEEKQDMTSEIIFTSQPSCGPCKAFERECVAPLRKAGWRVTKTSPDLRGTPSFDMRLGGRIVASKSGYGNRKAFFQWVKKVVKRNK
jgi:hypothetical protein